MTNKFISMMDGIRQGIASVLTPRCHRSDSLSIVSRQSLLPIFLLCLTLFLGAGQMWGATETVTISTIASANSWSNGTHYSGWSSSTGRFTFTASNSGQGLYYSSDNSWRGYKSKGSMVITARSGVTISSVTSSATATWSVAAGGGSASFTPTATIKFTSFTITYTEAASCTDPSPLLSISSSNTATLGTDKTLTTSGGNNGTVTWTVANGTGSATISGNTLTPTSAGTVTVTATQDDNGGKCGKVVNQTITISKAAATITLSEAGATRSVSGTYYGGDSYTLPTTTTALCGDKVLVGWSLVEVAETNTKPSSNYYEKGTSITLASGSNTFYAVFAVASGGGSSYGSKTLVSNSSSTYYSTGHITGESGTNKATWTADAFIMTQYKNTSSNAVPLNYAEIRAYQYHSLEFTPASGTTISSIVVTANSNSYASALGGSSISNCTKSVSGSTVTITPTDGTTAITLVQGAQSRINSIVVNYTTGGGTTYSNYATSCCTPLASINGSVLVVQSFDPYLSLFFC